MKSRKKAPVSTLAMPVIAVLLVAGFAVMLARSPLFSRFWEQRKSRSNIERIAEALCAYSLNHDGTLPARLSSLYPEYIDDFDSFFVRDEDHANPSLPGSGLEAPQAIDGYSPYTVMRLLTGSRAMVFERTGLWKDASIAWQKLATTEDGKGFNARESGRSAAGDFATILNGFLEAGAGKQGGVP